jgi:hypothetical protein
LPASTAATALCDELNLSRRLPAPDAEGAFFLHLRPGFHPPNLYDNPDWLRKQLAPNYQSSIAWHRLPKVAKVGHSPGDRRQPMNKSAFLVVGCVLILIGTVVTNPRKSILE